MPKKTIFALICGLIFSLGFAPFDQWLLSIISVVVLLFLIENTTSKESFLIGYLFGFGMWLSGISWLYVSIHFHGNISIIGSALLILVFISILAIYSGLIFFLNNYLKKITPKALSIFTLPVVWTSIELIRSYLFTGFPWLISGTMLADTLIDGLTPIIGAQGNSFFIIFISVLIFKIIKDLKFKLLPLGLIVVTVTLLISASATKTISWTDPIDKIKVSIHQPNLKLEDKWSRLGIIKSQEMMLSAIDKAERDQLVVFPETALILPEKENKNFIDLIVQKSSEKNITLVTGILGREDNDIRNRLQAFGSVNTYYDKVKLVPFGEFIPLKSFLGGFLDIINLNLTNTLPGEEITPINIGNLRISPSICYEIAFDELIRKTAKNSNLLLTISNDTWFGRSAGPIQHLEIAQNRALEHQKPLVRSTNSGISAFIGKKGQIIEKQEYFEEKLLNREIMLFSGQTFYSNYGNSPLIIFILSFLMIVFGNRLTFRNL
jgi:apolipoprotein N-acyltransferase